MNSRSYLLGISLLICSGCEALWGGFYKDPQTNSDMQNNGDLQNNGAPVDWTGPPTHLWSLRLGGIDDDLGSSVAIDRDGNVVVAGVLAHGGPSVSLSMGASDPHSKISDLTAGGYLLKLSPQGEVQWATSLPVPAPTAAYVAQVAVNDDGEIFVALQHGPTNDDAIQLYKYDKDGNVGWSGLPFKFGSWVGTNYIEIHTLLARTIVDGSSPRKTWLVLAGSCAGQPLPLIPKCTDGTFLLALTADNDGASVSNKTTHYEYDPSKTTLLTHASLASDLSVFWAGAGTSAQSRSILVRQRDGMSFDLGGTNTFQNDWGVDLASALDSNDDSFVAIRYTDTQLRKYATKSQSSGLPVLDPIRFAGAGEGDAFPLGMVVDGGDNPLLACSFRGGISLPDPAGAAGAAQLQTTPSAQRDVFLVKYDTMLRNRLWTLPVRVGSLNAMAKPPWVLDLAADSRRNRVAVLLHTSQGAGYAPLDGTNVILNPPGVATGNDVVLLYLGTP